MSTGRKPVLTVVQNRPQKMGKAFEETRAANEPKGASMVFKMPRGLSKEARAEWTRVVGLYRQLDAEVLNDLDLSTLAAYCENVAIFRKAQKEYQRYPLVLKDASGRVLENPHLAIMDKAGKNMSRFAEQLCLSPVGRARMGIAAAKKELEKDPSLEFFTKYGYD